MKGGAEYPGAGDDVKEAEHRAAQRGRDSWATHTARVAFPPFDGGTDVQEEAHLQAALAQQEGEPRSQAEPGSKLLVETS